jgi:zinc transport system ATP-binding protein
MSVPLPLVSVTHAHVQYGPKSILTDVNLSVHAGEIVTLIGPNGAGKSTLVKLALGLIQPRMGTVKIKPGIRIGYMPQRIHIEPFMPLSVVRFLTLGRQNGLAQKTVQEVLDNLSINPIREHPLQAISGGELQRVLLARALLKNPELLVLDEPVQGADITSQEELYQLITRIRDQTGCGILMVSHDLHLVMAGTDLVVCLNGHICCKGSPEQVRQHPAFLDLFGLQYPLALYTHRHNHRHEIGGDKSCH